MKAGERSAGLQADRLRTASGLCRDDARCVARDGTFALDYLWAALCMLGAVHFISR
jgi:hypothetical protein